MLLSLASAGVDPERLVARGYGATVPLDTNRTEQGRAKNRRIEFVQQDARTVTRDGDEAESSGDSDEGDSDKTVTKPEDGNVVDPGGAEAPRDPTDPWADMDADPGTPSSPFGDVERVDEVGTETPKSTDEVKRR